MEELKQRIDEMSNLETRTLEEILEAIKNIENQEEKLEIYDLFIKRAKNLFFISGMTEEEITEKLDQIFNLSIAMELNETDINEIFSENNFDEENILNYIRSSSEYGPLPLNPTTNEKREIEKINNRIKELEESLAVATDLDIDEEIKKLEEEKSSKIKETNELINKLIEELKNRKIHKKPEDLILEKEALQKEQDELWRKDSASGEGLDAKDENRYHEINNLIALIEKELENRKQHADKTIEELKQEIETIKNEQTNIMANAHANGLEPSEKDIARYHEINDLVKFLENEILRREATKYADRTTEDLIKEVTKYKEEQDELWRRSTATSGDMSEKEAERYEELIKLIDEIEKEIEIRNNYSRVKSDDLIKELEKYKEEQNELWRRSTATSGDMSEKDKERYEELIKLIEKIEKELENRKNNKSFIDKSDKELEKELENLRKKYKEIQSVYDKKVANLQELQKLRKVRDAYVKIQEDAINKFENEKLQDEELKTAIDEYVNNHELVTELEKYSNSDKLKKELKEDIYNNLKKKKIDKKENNKKAWMKGLVGVGGFVAGLGLSSVPGVGIIRMGIAGVKLASSAINFWTKKHPEGKIAKIKNDAMEKLTINFPGVMSKITKIQEKLQDRLSNPYVQWFVNGVSAGYLAGNIYELLTGRTVAGSIQDLFEREVPEPIIEPEPTPIPPEVDEINNGIDIDNGIDNGVDNGVDNVQRISDSVVPPIDYSDIVLNPGDTVDLSSLTEGFVASTAANPVDIMESVGKNVIFDKAVTLPDGKVMWHFIQPNGLGYAWFDAETVKDVIEAAAKTGGRTL